MRYFKISGILEIDETVMTEQANENLLDFVTDKITDNFIDDIETFFGGGIKEVDSEGNDI